MDADPSTGFLIGLHQTFPNGVAKYSQTRYGGTSLASPLLAGVIADVDQAAGGGRRVHQPGHLRACTATSSAIDDILPGGKQGMFRVTSPTVSCRTRRDSSSSSVRSPTKE